MSLSGGDQNIAFLFFFFSFTFFFFLINEEWGRHFWVAEGECVSVLGEVAGGDRKWEVGWESEGRDKKKNIVTVTESGYQHLIYNLQNFVLSNAVSKNSFGFVISNIQSNSGKLYPRLGDNCLFGC